MHGSQKKRQPDWSPESVDLLDSLRIAEAKEDFYCYRQYINPNMLLGWWQELIALEFMHFYRQLIAGKRPKLVLESPPQHGKTKQVTDFISWVGGKLPNFKQVYTSYSDNLGVGVNTEVQRIIDGSWHKRVFPGTTLSLTNTADHIGKPKRSSYLLEWVGHTGFFRNTTVRGQITGQGLDIGYIDDPLKGREEAQSKHIRDKVWSWLTDDFMTRFADHAGMVFTMTRWHVDDPIARFLEKFPDTRVVKYPALALRDEYINGMLLRRKGEPLFPAHKSLEFLLGQKKAMSQASWESLYQQNPIIVGGEVFPIQLMTHVPRPVDAQIKKSVRYWDKAGTAGGGAFSCGVLLHAMKDGTFVVGDVRRGQWNSMERERRMKQCAEIDKSQYPRVKIWVEQEPGSGGKESAENSIRNLAGFSVSKDKVTGSKETRADPYAAQCQNGNVRLVAADWNQPFIDEHEAWPNSRYKDQVDAAAGAFAKASEGGYDHTMSWVG